MPESEHSLPTRYDRLGDQIDGPVLDAIVVHPQSRGILSLPGEYSTDSRPPAHAVKITGTDPDSHRARLRHGTGDRTNTASTAPNAAVRAMATMIGLMCAATSTLP